MYCPSCGIEDNRSNQYCRSCGSDLRPIRRAITPDDNLTVRGGSARDEIGRAFAAKIRETRSAKELAKVTEEVLPEIEKFLESPVEKRLRRIRNGMIVASVGLGVTTGFTLAAIFSDVDLLFFAALGVVAFFIGLGFILNGYFLTVPKELSEQISDESQNRNIGDQTSELLMPESVSPLFGSVTEGTTRHLRKNDDD